MKVRWPTRVTCILSSRLTNLRSQHTNLRSHITYLQAHVTSRTMARLHTCAVQEHLEENGRVSGRWHERGECGGGMFPWCPVLYYFWLMNKRSFSGMHISNIGATICRTVDFSLRWWPEWIVLLCFSKNIFYSMRCLILIGVDINSTGLRET